MRIIITAGYARSKAAMAMAELLRRSGHEICAVIVTRALSPRRIRRQLRQQGIAGLLRSAGRVLGVGEKQRNGVLRRFLHRHAIDFRSVGGWCRSRGVRCVVVSDLNSRKALIALEQLQPEAVVYAGGGILARPFIDAARGNIVNVHCGPLPAIRGMNAIEWALLLDEPLQSSLHIVDSGIDSGPILGRFAVELEAGERIASLREKAVVVGIEGLVRTLEGAPSLASLPSEPNAAPPGLRHCYSMAPAIRELAEAKLARTAPAGDG